ncbi:transposon Ty3-I Gag-Pol polyprotein [Trichonephila clavipes]|nr:transposon Ty3-I Gag-Pol polyprotein [Trichonephila clavipes]
MKVSSNPLESHWSSPIVLEAGLKLNSKKCLFAAQEVKILGHLVSSNGVRPDPDKIKAVSVISPKPLQSLLKSGVEFHWGPEEVEAFNSLKKALTSDPVLGMKNFDPDGKLWLPVIPKHLRADILKALQTDAPPQDTLVSRKLMTGYAKRFFTGRECTENVVRYVMHCRECQRRKSVPQRPPGRLVPIPPSYSSFPSHWN